jgi:hypothetical protein
MNVRASEERPRPYPHPHSARKLTIAFDPLDNEYDPLPAAVAAEEEVKTAQRATRRRESFRAVANLVRRSSGLSCESSALEDEEEEDEGEREFTPVI